MIDVLRRARRAGIATTTYPAVPESAPPAYRGQVQLDVNRCVGDGACARACPSIAIDVTTLATGGWTWQLDDARCVFCGLCADVCPTTALSLSNEFELAVRKRGDLVVSATFEPASVSVSNDGETT